MYRAHEIAEHRRIFKKRGVTEQICDLVRSWNGARIGREGWRTADDDDLRLTVTPPDCHQEHLCPGAMYICPDAAVARVLSRAVRALAFKDVTAQEPGLVDLIDEVMASWSDKPMCCEEAQKEVNFSFCGLLFHLTRPGCPGRKRVRQSRKLQAHVQCVQVTCEPFLDWPFAPDLLEVMGL